MKLFVVISVNLFLSDYLESIISCLKGTFISLRFEDDSCDIVCLVGNSPSTLSRFFRAFSHKLYHLCKSSANPYTSQMIKTHFKIIRFEKNLTNPNATFTTSAYNHIQSLLKSRTKITSVSTNNLDHTPIFKEVLFKFHLDKQNSTQTKFTIKKSTIWNYSKDITSSSSLLDANFVHEFSYLNLSSLDFEEQLKLSANFAKLDI